MRISDWSSDVCSSDLGPVARPDAASMARSDHQLASRRSEQRADRGHQRTHQADQAHRHRVPEPAELPDPGAALRRQAQLGPTPHHRTPRSEEHTYELQSLMRISYAVLCLKKKKHRNTKTHTNQLHLYTLD